MKLCSSCGQQFSPRTGTSGRPRTRCDDCRTNHAKIDGTRWRKVRALVLEGAPRCSVPGCGRRAGTVDHIVPLSKGGDPYDLGNLQPMCSHHNSSKASRVRNDLPPATGASAPLALPGRERGKWPLGECTWGHGSTCPGGPIPHSRDWWT